MNKRMPVGVDDFKEVREKYYFIDKTNFIKDLIDGHGKVTLLTRPRRFGKTLTMSMLKYFFTIDYAAENRKLFQGLAIEKAGEDYMKEQGKYPVVFLSLKGCKALRWEEAYGKLKYNIVTIFDEFNYLQQSDMISAVEKQNFAEVLFGKENGLYSQSLELLTRLLHKHHGVKPILLIDEYDVPVQCGWENNYYDEVIMFLKGWLSAGLKTNVSLNFAVLTGVLRISKESIFSDLNNLDVCSIMTKKYNDVLGFTPVEVERIATDLGIEEQLPQIKEWYDGYSFVGQEIYNPWSVIKYIDADCKPQPYWLNTSGNGIVRLLLEAISDERLAMLRTIFNGGLVESEVNEGVIYDDIVQDENALYTMLLTTGYLTLRKEEIIDDLTTFYYLGIPNLEIKGVYKREILDRLNDSMPTRKLNGMFKALLSGEAKTFEYHLQEILTQMVSYYDTKNKESFYHGLLLGLTALLSATYRVESNRESGYGRFDVAIMPRQPDKAGVIMEFKVADTENRLEQVARTALDQIEEKAYTAGFSECESTTMMKYGIAFCGKKVKILRG